MASTAFVDGSTLTAASWFNDVDTFVYSRLTSVAGTNTITATGPVSMTAYATGQRFTFVPANTNTGATTVNITPSGGAALGAKNIFAGGAACVAGEIIANIPCEIEYDGTQFNLIGPFSGGLVPGRLVSISGANSTSNTVLEIENTSNAAAASHAYLDVAVGGTTSTGDPHVRFTIPSGSSWYAGADNSDSDSFIIGRGSAVGTTPSITISTADAVTLAGALTVSGGIATIGAQTNSNDTTILQGVLLGRTGGIFGQPSSDVFYVTQNAYYNAGWKYKTTNEALRFDMDGTLASPVYSFSTAASGTADSAITWESQFQIVAVNGATRWITVSGSTTNPTIDVTAGSLAITPAVITGSSITTSAPAGGTAGAWKFGVAAAVSPTSPNRTIELDVGGTIYYLHAKTTND